MKSALVALVIASIGIPSPVLADVDRTEAPLPEPEPEPSPPPRPKKRSAVEQLVYDALRAFVKGDIKTSKRLLERARRLNPRYAPIYRLLVRVYLQLGDKAAARHAYRTYLRLAPNPPDARWIEDQLAKI